MNAIGLDLGTSGVKAVVLSERGELLGEQWRTSGDRLWTTTGDVPERILLIDLDQDRIWPEDGDRDAIFRGAAQALARELEAQGRLPDLALLQS